MRKIFSIFIVFLTAMLFGIGNSSYAQSRISVAAINPKIFDSIEKSENEFKSFRFRDVLNGILLQRRVKSSDVCDEKDPVSKRILSDYGAIFLADASVLPPPVCIFQSEQQVADFQKQTQIAAVQINGATIELQARAMQALTAARAEALELGLNITPRDGAEAARRNYSDTLRLWNSRFQPALKFWQKRGRLTAGDVNRLQSLSIGEQVRAVLELEKRGIYFSTDFSKSILYSVAAPGCSQHLSLLAFDANEFANPQVRRILARHGWFRTVKNDQPHFTFLGLPEEKLPAAGLRKISTNTGEYWIPDV
jgi:hypothetical protein